MQKGGGCGRIPGNPLGFKSMKMDVRNCPCLGILDSFAKLKRNIGILSELESRSPGTIQRPKFSLFILFRTLVWNISFWVLTMFLTCRPNYCSPFYQPIDSVTNILFSSGTTGWKVVGRVTYSLTVLMIYLCFMHYFFFFFFAYTRRSKSHTVDPSISYSMCCWFMGTFRCSSRRCLLLAH